MKTIKCIIINFILIFLAVLVGCKKEISKTLPLVSTHLVSDISLTTATSGGVISTIDKSSVSSRGVCWATNENPSINDAKTIDGSGVGAFLSSIRGLVANQTYYLRAYAINDVGIGYGNIIKFTTQDDTHLTSTEQLYPGINGTEVSIELFGATIICQLINNEYVYQGDILVANNIAKGSSSTNIKKWPDNTIYYSINDNLPSLQKDAVRDAIIEFQTKTNLIFKVRTTETNYIEFLRDENGSGSIIGMNSYYTIGPYPPIYDHNIIRLAYWALSGAVMHEIGHAVGLFHEHNKPNRDDFVEIIKDNIKKGKYSQFIKDGGNLNTSGFDWKSIMLYPSISDFSIEGRPTMVRKSDRDTFDSNRSYLSEGDIYLINLMYPNPPKVSTVKVSSITSITANCTGEVLSDGGWNVYERGVCWGINPSPTIQDNKITNGNGRGSFSCNITGLSPSTNYYVRAYAINSSGVGPGYGEVLNFKTNSAILSPTVSTTEVSEIKSNSAKVGGNVTSDGGSNITERGVFYSTNTVSSGTKMEIGNGTGLFSTTLSGLNPGTTYYVKAYAINTEGIAYGGSVNFTTLVGNISLIAAFTASSISINLGQPIQFSDQSTGNPTSWSWDFGDGSTSISKNPTHTYSKAGTYTVSLTVSSNTGSNTITKTNFITVTDINGILFNPNLTYGTVTDIDGNKYKTIQIGTKVWMAENLKVTKLNDGTPISFESSNNSWMTKVNPLYCWYNNDIENKNTYGALYNRHTVNTGKLCPIGWHVSTDSNWSTLTNNTGGDNNAAIKLKETGNYHWSGTSSNATNSSGFTALPGGIRYENGAFSGLKNNGTWWCTNPENYAFSSWYRQMFYNANDIQKYGLNLSPQLGLSVRCVKD